MNKAFCELFFALEFNQQLEKIGLKKGVYFAEAQKFEYLGDKNRYRMVLMAAPKNQQDFDQSKIIITPDDALVRPDGKPIK